MAKLLLIEHNFIEVKKPIKQSNHRGAERDVRIILVEREVEADVTSDVYGRQRNMYDDPWGRDAGVISKRRAKYDAKIIIGDVGISMTLQEAINLTNKLNNEISNVMQEVRA